MSDYLHLQNLLKKYKPRKSVKKNNKKTDVFQFIQNPEYVSQLAPTFTDNLNNGYLRTDLILTLFKAKLPLSQTYRKNVSFCPRTEIFAPSQKQEIRSIKRENVN